MPTQTYVQNMNISLRGSLVLLGACENCFINRRMSKYFIPRGRNTSYYRSSRDICEYSALQLYYRIDTIHMQYSSELAARIETSPTKKLKPIKQALLAQNIQLIDFADGEPELSISDETHETITKSLREGHYKYGAAQGSQTLLRTIAEIRHVPIENIVIGYGVKHLFYSLLQTYCNPGDTILMLQPNWMIYAQQAKALGINVVGCPMRKDSFDVDFDLLEKLLTENPNIRLIVTSTPNNPTGKCLSQKERQHLLEIATKNKLLLVLDEVFRDLLPSGEKPDDIPFSENLVSITSSSKSYGMTGFRIGYLLGPTPVVSNITQYLYLTVTNVPEFIQDAYVSELKNSSRLTENTTLIQHKQKIMESAIEACTYISNTPHNGGICMFPKITYPKGVDEWQLAEKLMKEAHVAVVPGIAFSYIGYIRLNYAHLSDSEIIEGVQRIEAYLAKLNQ